MATTDIGNTPTKEEILYDGSSELGYGDPNGQYFDQGMVRVNKRTAGQAYDEGTGTWGTGQDTGIGRYGETIKTGVSKDNPNVMNISAYGKPDVKQTFGNQTQNQTQSSAGQTEQRQPNVDDVRGMIEKKYGVSFTNNPYDTADKRLDSELAGVFRSRYGVPITDIDKLPKEAKKEWDTEVEKHQTSYRASEKEKFDNAWKDYQSALGHHERTVKENAAKGVKEQTAKIAQLKDYMTKNYTDPNKKYFEEIARAKAKKEEIDPERAKYLRTNIDWNNQQSAIIQQNINRLVNGENFPIPPLGNIPKNTPETKSAGNAEGLKKLTPDIISQIKSKAKTRQEAEKMAKDLGYDLGV